MTSFTPSRRQVLAGVGALGAASLGAGYAAAVTTRPRPFTRYTYAQSTDGADLLRVAWYETYNGTYQGSQLGPDAPPEAWDHTDLGTYVAFDGASVRVDDALPGDSGTVVLGLSPAGETDVRVWFRLLLVCAPENGVNEPEREVDTAADGPDAGELADALRFTLWHDTGVANLAACDGEYTMRGVPGLSEPRIAYGTPRDPVAGEPYAGEDPAAGYPLDLATGQGRTCLRAGTQTCVGFEWEIPATVGNVIQTDGLEFLLQFVPVACDDETNPFTTGVLPGPGDVACGVSDD